MAWTFPRFFSSLPFFSLSRFFYTKRGLPRFDSPPLPIHPGLFHAYLEQTKIRFWRTNNTDCMSLNGRMLLLPRRPMANNRIVLWQFTSLLQAAGCSDRKNLFYTSSTTMNMFQWSQATTQDVRKSRAYFSRGFFFFSPQVGVNI